MTSIAPEAHASSVDEPDAAPQGDLPPAARPADPRAEPAQEEAPMPHGSDLPRGETPGAKGAPPRGGWLFAHARWDAVLVALTLLEIALTAVGAASFSGFLRAHGPLSTALSYGALGALLVFLNCTNYQCIAHNFIHKPFFRSRVHNRVFAVVNTLGLGAPQSLYRVHHLNHHRYGNDRKDPDTHQTKDRSSIYRFSNDPERPEPLLSYAVLGPMRMGLGELLEEAKRLRLAGQILVETVALVALVAALFAVDWRGALLFFLPVWYLGQVAAYAENYLEHNHAIPGSTRTDSVSCYGALYNLVWFNNGYHQEHHFRPQVHWLDIEQVRAEMLPESERRVVRGAHWLNL
jgi:fatty acid desaturase